DDARLRVPLRAVAPHVEVPPRRARAGPAGSLEPRVLVRGVVQHELGDHLQPPPTRLAHERPKVPEGPVGRMNALVLGDVVAVVPERRGIEGKQPDSRDPEVPEVIQLVDQPRQVPDAVGVPVVEGANVQLVDDRVSVPERTVGAGHHMKDSTSCSVRTLALIRNTCARNTDGSSTTKLPDPCHTWRASVSKSWTWKPWSGSTPSESRSSSSHPSCVRRGLSFTTVRTTFARSSVHLL